MTEGLWLKILPRLPATLKKLAITLKVKGKDIENEVLRGGHKDLFLPDIENGKKVIGLSVAGEEFVKIEQIEMLDKPSPKPTTKTPGQVPLYESETKLGEIIWKPEEKTTWFAVLDKNTSDIEYTDIITNSSPIRPVMDEGVEMGAILLPTGAEEYNTEPDLLKELLQHIRTYLDVSAEFGRLSAYYIMLSWVSDKINTIPYLRVLGDTGTGKSRFLDVIGRLCYRACIVSGAVTPAPIYRMIKKWQGSVLIDEADFKDSDAMHEVIKILNCGFERTRPILRCLKDDPDNLQFLPSFGPKILATRMTYKDKALESRCLTYIMEETDREDIPPTLPQKFFEDERTLRNKLLMFRFRNRDRINLKMIEGFSISNIEPRLKQAASAFAVLMDIPGMKELVVSFFQEYNKLLIEERAESFEGAIVSILVDFWKNDETISSQDIADRMNVGRSEKRKIAPHTIGRYLKSLKIITKNKKIEPGVVRKCVVWDENIMKKLKRRYVPDDNSSGGSISSGECNDSLKHFNVRRESGAATSATNATKKMRRVYTTSATSATLLLDVLGNSTYPYSYLINRWKEVAAGSGKPQDLDEILEKLKREGIIHEPTPGMYQKV